MSGNIPAITSPQIISYIFKWFLKKKVHNIYSIIPIMFQIIVNIQMIQNDIIIGNNMFQNHQRHLLFFRFSFHYFNCIELDIH